MQKLKAILVLLVIIVSIIPLYSFNKYLQKQLRPRDAGGRLILYLLAAMVLIFIFAFLLVLTIRYTFAISPYFYANNKL